MAGCQPEIHFDKEVYFPGEEVTGRVNVKTEKDMTARKVEITFEGKAVTAVTYHKHEPRVATEVETGLKARDVFVQMKHEVWTPSDGKNTFPSGEYEWNFSFELPKNCPTSFEADYGFIRYSVMTQIDVPNWIDTYVEMAVSVSSQIDLNSIPGARDKAEITVAKRMEACGCIPIFKDVGPFSRGSATVTISTPTLGVVSGQTMSVSGNIQNGTTRRIKAIQYALFQKVSYRKSSPFTIVDQACPPGLADWKSDTFRLCKAEQNVDVAVGASKPINFTLTVPPAVATIRNSKLLSVEYFLGVKVKYSSKLCSASSAELNIIIGNVPLMEPGQTKLPPHTFENGYLAKCWVSRFKNRDEFRPKFTYYHNAITVEPK